MSNQPKETTANKEAAASKKAAPTPKKTVVKKVAQSDPKQKSSSGVAWLAIILVLATAGAGYVGFSQLKEQVDQLSTSAGSAQKSSDNLSNELQTSTSDINSNVSSLSSELATLKQSSTDSINRLEKQVGKNRLQWLIAEAEYLSSVANTRLLLAGDINTAIVALQAADQRLKENGDPLTFPIRKQLAKEINLLKSAEPADTVGISSQLIALEEAVSKMEISEPHAGTAQAPAIGKGDASPIPENIQETLNDAWANFSKLVTVRRNDSPMAALMTPERVELIRKNLSLKLEAARLALINQDEALYKASIGISMTWLSDYFDAENPAVKTALEQLSTLKETLIKVELPSIALSLKMLRELPLLDSSEQKKTFIKKTAKVAPKEASVSTKPAVKAAVAEKRKTKKNADTPATETKELDTKTIENAVETKL